MRVTVQFSCQNSGWFLKIYKISALSIFSVPWIKQFTMVVNALDNVKARNHVNRLCLGADVPLVESGTSGYLGESMIVWKGHTSCYECIVSLFDVYL